MDVVKGDYCDLIELTPEIYSDLTGMDLPPVTSAVVVIAKQCR
jgi:hypothetical protein